MKYISCVIALVAFAGGVSAAQPVASRNAKKPPGSRLCAGEALSAGRTLRWNARSGCWGTTGNGSSGTGVLAASLPVSVLAYGCKGDGSTDDSMCVTKAYTATPTNGTLTFPPGYVFKFGSLVIGKSMHMEIQGRILLTGTLDICSGGVTISGTNTGAFVNSFNQPTTITWAGASSGVMIRAGGCDTNTRGMFGIRITNLGMDGAEIANVTGLKLGNSASSNSAIGATFSAFDNLLIQGTFKAIDIQKGSEQNHFSKIVIGNNTRKAFVSGSVGVCVACVAGSTNITTNYFDGLSITGHDTSTLVGGGANHLRPVTTVITNSIFNGSRSVDLNIANGVNTVVENCYFEDDTSVRTPIVIGNNTFARTNLQVPQGTIIRQNLFSGGDSTGRAAPFIHAVRYSKLWIEDNLYGGALTSANSIFVFNDGTEGWRGAHQGGIYFGNRSADTGVATEIGPTVAGFETAEFQGGTQPYSYSDTSPFWATDMTFSRNIFVNGTENVLRMPSGGAFQFRNNASTRDLNAVSKDSGDNFYVGDGKSGGEVYLQTNGGIGLVVKKTGAVQLNKLPGCPVGQIAQLYIDQDKQIAQGICH